MKITLRLIFFKFSFNSKFILLSLFSLVYRNYFVSCLDFLVHLHIMIPGNEEVESAALLEVGQDSYLRHECSF